MTDTHEPDQPAIGAAVRPANLSISTSIEYGGAVVIAIRGAIEHLDAPRITEAVQAALQRHRPATLYIDLGLVTYMDTSGIGALVACQRAATHSGARVVVRSSSPFVGRLLEISGLGDYFA